MRFGVLDHLVDLGLREAARRFDLDALLLAGRHVLGRHVHDPVCIDIEAHFDLRHTARRGRDANQVEPSQRPVVDRHFALTLEHVNRHGRLVVRRGREDL